MVVTTACWYKLTLNAKDFYMKESPEVKYITGMEKTVIAGVDGKRCEGVNVGHSKDVTVTIYNTEADNFDDIIALCELDIGALASASYVAMTLVKMDGTGANWGPWNVLPKDPSAVLQVKDGGHYMNVTLEVYDAVPALV